MSVAVTPPAVRAVAATLELLAEHGVDATRDPGAFYPQPTGVLVGLPELVGRGLGSRTFTVPVDVVSGDPLNDELAVDRLYALADDVATALHWNAYRPASYRSGVNAEPLPSIRLDVTVTVTELAELAEQED